MRLRVFMSCTDVPPGVAIVPYHAPPCVYSCHVRMCPQVAEAQQRMSSLMAAHTALAEQLAQEQQRQRDTGLQVGHCDVGGRH